MKKLTFFLILFIAVAIPQQRTQMQSINWVTLQSDANTITAPGQLIIITLNGSLNIPIISAALTLKYDPACFRVTSHHPGSLLNGANAVAQAQPGQFDLTYQLQDKNLGQTGEGSLINIQLEALKLCASDISVPANTILLKISDAKGIIVTLPGVEYRALTLHLAKGQAPVVTAAPATATVQLPQITWIDSTLLFLLLLILLPIAGTIFYILLRRRFKHPVKPSPTPTIPVPGPLQESNIPALIHAAGVERPILLSQQRTQLGRHTEIIQRGGRFYLADTGSQNGTFLNGNHVGPGYHFLHDGDQVRLGHETSYRFFKPSKPTGI